MAEQSRPRAGISRASRPQRIWYAQIPDRKREVPNECGDNWVGSSLLTAIDRVEERVEEMFNTSAGPVRAPALQDTTSIADTAVVQALIKQEVTHRLEEKINDLVVTARLNQLESAQKLYRTKIDALLTSYDTERRVLEDLDELHRHEYLLNSALVERLFEAPALGDLGNPDAIFEETTFGLQGTDSVNSVLVSCVQKLMLKVKMLERKIEALENCLVKKEE